MVEHQSAECKGLRSIPHGDSEYFFFVPWKRLENIFLYFFTQPKTYHPSYTI